MARDEAERWEQRQIAAPAVDPFAGVLDMEPRLPLAAVIAVALLLHVAAAAGATAVALFSEMFRWNQGLTESVALRLGQTFDIEVDKPAPPPPPPDPPKEEPKPEPEPIAKPEPKEIKEEPPPPPAAAEAAKVLTQEPAKDEPLDFTGNTFVQGTGSTYAGGTTQAGGTSKTAVYKTAAVATGVPGGTGTAPVPVAPRIDRSRAAALSGSTDWDCPFPAEADAEQIDNSAVIIQVKVRPDGTAENVNVLQDPGHGFGREARKCAMRKRYNAAFDVDGNPIAGMTKQIRVRFSR
jgi:protein TonB